MRPSRGLSRSRIQLGATLTMIAATGLAGCSAGVDAYVPANVKAMMEVPFPADGQIHVQKHGKFGLKPSTLFCTHRSGFALDADQIRKALKRLGQSDYLNGSSRLNGIAGRNPSPRCTPEKAAKDTVFVRGSEGPNRLGTPYRLVLAVWQCNPARGGASWVGGVERADGRRRDANLDTLPIGDDLAIFGPNRDEQRRAAHVESSMKLNLSEISASFVPVLEGK